MPAYASVVIDVDSTLCGVEGIDFLAARRGPEVTARIVALTDRAMTGEIPLESIYGHRLTTIRPTRADIAALATEYERTLAPGAADAIAAMRAAGVRARPRERRDPRGDRSRRADARLRRRRPARRFAPLRRRGQLPGLRPELAAHDAAGKARAGHRLDREWSAAAARARRWRWRDRREARRRRRRALPRSRASRGEPTSSRVADLEIPTFASSSRSSPAGTRCIEIDGLASTTVTRHSTTNLSTPTTISTFGTFFLPGPDRGASRDPRRDDAADDPASWSRRSRSSSRGSRWDCATSSSPRAPSTSARRRRAA